MLPCSPSSMKWSRSISFPTKSATLNQIISPSEGIEIEDCLALKPLNLRATLDKNGAYEGVDFVVIAIPPIASALGRSRQ